MTKPKKTLEEKQQEREAIKAKAVALKQQHYSISAIAKKLGMAYGTIYGYLQEEKDKWEVVHNEPEGDKGIEMCEPEAKENKIVEVVEQVQEQAQEQKEEQEESLFSVNEVIQNQIVMMRMQGESISAIARKAKTDTEEVIRILDHYKVKKTHFLDINNMDERRSKFVYEKGDIVVINPPGDNLGNEDQIDYSGYGSVQDNGFWGRYGVVIQNDIGNKHSPTVIVASITSKVKKLDMPTHVLITSEALKYTSMVLAEQIKTFDKKYLKFIGKVSVEELIEIEKAVACSLSSPGSCTPVLEIEREVIKLPRFRRLKQQLTGIFEYGIDSEIEIKSENGIFKLRFDQLKEFIADLQDIEEAFGER